MNIKPEVCGSCACMGVCVCVGERERERELQAEREESQLTDRQTEKQTDRSRVGVGKEGDLAMEGLAAFATAVESRS